MKIYTIVSETYFKVELFFSFNLQIPGVNKRNKVFLVANSYCISVWRPGNIYVLTSGANTCCALLRSGVPYANRFISTCC